MRIEFAHIQDRATNGQLVDFAVFHAKANVDTDAGRRTWLNQLIFAARQIGRKVDAAALVYEQGNQIKWWGDHFPVDWINKNGIPAPSYYVSF